METDREIAEHALAHVEGGPNYASRLAEACAREGRKAARAELIANCETCGGDYATTGLNSTCPCEARKAGLRDAAKVVNDWCLSVARCKALDEIGSKTDRKLNRAEVVAAFTQAQLAPYIRALAEEGP